MLQLLGTSCFELRFAFSTTLGQSLLSQVCMQLAGPRLQLQVTWLSVNTWLQSCYCSSTDGFLEFVRLR